MRKLSLVMMAVALTVAAQAQFGIYAGLNIANWGGADATNAIPGADKNGQLGLNVGATYNVPVSEHFSIVPGAEFSAQGAKFTAGGAEANVNTDYINLDVLARWNSGQGFSIGAGPYAGFLMSAKVKQDGQPDDDIKDNLKGTDFGILFRAGYFFTEHFGIQAGFRLGFSTIDDTTPAQDIKNRVFCASVVYSISGPGKAAKNEKK